MIIIPEDFELTVGPLDTRKSYSGNSKKVDMKKPGYMAGLFV